jgi:hypothetical protein
MPRGFTWAQYTDDLGAVWALQVDTEYFHMLERGWPDLDPTGLQGVPRGWRPRKALGIEASGREHKAIAASLDAPIWTGVATEFTILSNDGEPILCTIIGLLQERRTSPSPDA